MSKQIFLLFTSALLFLLSCGPNNSTNSQNEVGDSVQLYGAKVATSASNLPTCDSTQVGQLFYVLGDENFQFCSTDGYQTIDLRGADGSNGTAGQNGTNGTDGSDGANGLDGSSCSVITNATGRKTILCEDGTSATVTDGASCTVADNQDGSYDLTCSGTTVTVRNGADGQNGTNGVDGTNGTDGTNGVDGVNGTNGSSFLSGTTPPPENLGMNGDTYLDMYRSAYYSKVNGSWELQTFDASRAFQDSRDLRIYKKVVIGNQIWMAENLAYLPSVNAKADTSSITAKYYVYDFDDTVVADAKATSYYNTYGVLYNWPAAMAGSASSAVSPSGVKGICPTGWHLPSVEEWTTLKTFVGGASTAGTKLKSVNGWTTVGVTGMDAYGFSALPGGYFSSWDFSDSLNNGYWWSATEFIGSSAYYQYMVYNSAIVYWMDINKRLGFSLRCLQD